MTCLCGDVESDQDARRECSCDEDDTPSRSAWVQLATNNELVFRGRKKVASVTTTFLVVKCKINSLL